MAPERIPVEPQTEEEARALLEEAQAKMRKHLGKVDQHLDGLAQRFRSELEAAQAEIAGLEAQLQELAPHQDRPSGAFHYGRLRVLLESRRAYATTLEVELACAQANQALARSGPPDGWDGQSRLLKSPQTSPRYREARARMDYFLVAFQWMSHLEVIDAFLRAAGSEPAIRSVHAAEEARREATAETLAALLAQDEALQLALARVIEDLQLAQALLPWAKVALARVESMPGDAKLAALQDPDWNKLNRVRITLNALSETLEKHPQLASFPFAVRYEPATQVREQPESETAQAAEPAAEASL